MTDMLFKMLGIGLGWLVIGGAISLGITALLVFYIIIPAIQIILHMVGY